MARAGLQEQEQLGIQEQYRASGGPEGEPGSQRDGLKSLEAAWSWALVPRAAEQEVPLPHSTVGKTCCSERLQYRKNRVQARL